MSWKLLASALPGHERHVTYYLLANYLDLKYEATKEEAVITEAVVTEHQSLERTDGDDNEFLVRQFNDLGSVRGKKFDVANDFGEAAGAFTIVSNRRR